MGKYLKSASGGGLSSSSLPAVAPRWVKVTKTYADLSTAALTNDIEIYSLPAGGVIHAVKLKHSAAFAGTLISAYTASVGIVGSLLKYAGAFSIFTAPSSTNLQLSFLPGAEDHASATSIRLSVVSVGAFLNAASVGSLDVWLLISSAV